MYTAEVTVTDAAGGSDSQAIAITVTDPPGNRAPQVEAAAVPASGRAPLDVLFTAAGTDPDGDALTYAWDFGDGSAAATGRRARHTYTTNGTFEAKVTVTDRAGATASATVTVVVGNPPDNQAPTVVAAADPAGGTAPLKVNFSAAGTDPDGDPLSLRLELRRRRPGRRAEGDAHVRRGGQLHRHGHRARRGRRRPGRRR